MKHLINIRLVSLLLSLALIIVGVPLTVIAKGISNLVESSPKSENATIENAESSEQEAADILTESFEVMELREETVKHFRTEDGSYVAAQ